MDRMVTLSPREPCKKRSGRPNLPLPIRATVIVRLFRSILAKIFVVLGLGRKTALFGLGALKWFKQNICRSTSSNEFWKYCTT